MKCVDIFERLEEFLATFLRDAGLQKGDVHEVRLARKSFLKDMQRCAWNTLTTAPAMQRTVLLFVCHVFDRQSCAQFLLSFSAEPWIIKRLISSNK